MVRIAAVDTRNSRQHVKNDKASAPIDLLDLRPNDPKSVRVEEQMKQPNVNKDRSNEPPPLAFCNFGIRLHTECHQRRLVGAASGQSHQKKNEDIQSEEDVCISGTPFPDSLKEVEMVIRNHRSIPLLAEEGWRKAPGWSGRPKRVAGLLLRLRPVGLALRATPSARSARHPSSARRGIFSSRSSWHSWLFQPAA